MKSHQDLRPEEQHLNAKRRATNLCHSRTVKFAALAVALACIGPGAMAGGGQPITRVEEDWRIEFGSPDPETNAPQVIMTISPWANLDGPHAVFEVNHKTQPNYSAGGLQLQRWNGDNVVEYKSSHKGNVLSDD